MFLSQDPNVLAQRLELLIASHKPGNTGVINESVSILDELLKQKQIDRELYKQISAAIK